MPSLNQLHHLVTSFSFKKPILASYISNTVSVVSESGDPIFGPVDHAAWECLHKQIIYENSLVCVYIINKCILHNFTLHTDLHMIPHENILTFMLTCIIDNSSALLVCLHL